ncbi:unnamed protein product [Nippostrongylus brasiliensis]|uniref:CUB domain-containing protein n=1 Tax=Nippostrongylus brasiliensis TaxID=27835 RepID=A0A158R003_NIPBR|nr:unnamed protein product [Nippostrongylus brasiliensis]
MNIEVVDEEAISDVRTSTAALNLHGRRSVQDECGALRGEGALSLHSFTSPSYPNRYPANMDCFRVIQARPGFDIFVHFHHQFQYNLQNIKSKEFRDGRYGFSPLIGRFCGMDLPKTEIRARSDCQIQFQHALDGFIETKTLLNDMPLNFTGSLDCIWLIEVPHEYNIALYINEFSLYAPNNCGHNFVEIYSGTTSDQPLRSCGDDNCVPQALVCNGRNNCPYGNDELNCHVGMYD